MHVLIDARLLHRPKSGLERVQINIIRELAGRKEIKRLRVVVMRGTVLPADLPQDVEKLEVTSTGDILRELLAENESDRPDVYHLTYFPDRTPWDLVLPLAAPAAVVEVHDAILNRHPEYHPNRDAWAWYHNFTSQLVQSAHRLLVHSKSVAREVEADLGGDLDNTDVAPLAVDPALLTPMSHTEVKARLRSLDISGDYFLSVGKDYPHKGHATLFAAFAELPEPVRLVCAGSKVWNQGRDTDDVLDQLGIQSRVRWIQDLDDLDIKALLQGSQALVFPSHEEGFGLPPIEAMALGVPVLAARAMSIPEVCGKGAWLFKPGDRAELSALMRKVLAGGQDVERLVQNGHQQAKKYSWSRTADATIACYHNAIRAAKRSRSRSSKAAKELSSVLGIIGESPFDNGSELAAWKQRCLGSEARLGEVESDREAVITRLRELERSASLPQTPLPMGDALRRPRWSLWRRLRKIRDGLWKSMSSG
jgi:glycosyltransferase involved in cell wall biosynthesis